jgi:hypothetical protein
LKSCTELGHSWIFLHGYLAIPLVRNPKNFQKTQNFLNLILVKAIGEEKNSQKLSHETRPATIQSIGLPEYPLLRGVSGGPSGGDSIQDLEDPEPSQKKKEGRS